MTRPTHRAPTARGRRWARSAASSTSACPPPAAPSTSTTRRTPALIGDCVHCGFCLPTCPTYVLWGEEMDSPRGRIYLMKEGLEGEPMTDSMVSHWDACLGCMACVTACPSGRAVRHADRADPGAGRAPPRAARRRTGRCAG